MEMPNSRSRSVSHSVGSMAPDDFLVAVCLVERDAVSRSIAERVAGDGQILKERLAALCWIFLQFFGANTDVLATEVSFFVVV
ncbi:hypothetical protein [Haladaptatus sp. DYSN1]|uniref:hypothetical protein n=1 Tax=unclassified Haladaptatus TaxID=2622732 RepID=UPI0024068495|nr:hypothetical protein [Haladaptatus sp. DYSN1]